MILSLLACNTLNETVTMTGSVEDAPYGRGDPAAAEMIVRGLDLVEVDTVEIGADGIYEVTVPAGVGFYAEISGDDGIAAAFSGTAGAFDFEAPPGYPWVVTEAWRDDAVAAFDACPTFGAEGAVVLGEVRVNEGGENYGDMTLVPYGVVRVFASDGEIYTACYLDDDGASVADAEVTGNTGRFVAFGVPAGEAVVEVGYDLGDSRPVELYQFLVPADGVVPVYPALVNLPH